MAIIQILHDEQVAMIRYSGERSRTGSIAQDRKLAVFAHLLEAYPYPHQPYSRQRLPE